MQPFLMEKPVTHSTASKFSAVLIGVLTLVEYITLWAGPTNGNHTADMQTTMLQLVLNNQMKAIFPCYYQFNAFKYPRQGFNVLRRTTRFRAIHCRVTGVSKLATHKIHNKDNISSRVNMQTHTGPDHDLSTLTSESMHALRWLYRV